MTRLLFAALALSFLFAPRVYAENGMDTEIDHLLDTVASSNCVFIRNGKEHGAEDAKDHLSLKRRRGKKYFSSAEEFIENLASSSSWTGKPYRIRCDDGAEQLAAVWFAAVLDDYRREQ